MAKCAWCPWKGSTEDAQFAAHARGNHPVEYRRMLRLMREIDEDIKAAQRQAGYPVDRNISDGNLDDEESDARFNP